MAAKGMIPPLETGIVKHVVIVKRKKECAYDVCRGKE